MLLNHQGEGEDGQVAQAMNGYRHKKVFLDFICNGKHKTADELGYGYDAAGCVGVRQYKE